MRQAQLHNLFRRCVKADCLAGFQVGKPLWQGTFQYADGDGRIRIEISLCATQRLRFFRLHHLSFGQCLMLGWCRMNRFGGMRHDWFRGGINLLEISRVLIRRYVFVAFAGMFLRKSGQLRS